MRAFGYLRLSRERESSTSIAKQRESVERFCHEHDWTLLESFEDVDVSGTKESRPGLDRMLARLAECDVIVFHRLDRIMRSVLGFAKLLERCRASGVELVSATEPFDTSSAIGRAFVWLLASVAEIEAENTSKRIKATHAHLLSQGRPVGRARTFGWRSDPTTKAWVQIPDEVAVLRLMVDSYLAGIGLQAIARGLNTGTLMGVPISGVDGGCWTSNQVNRVLTNPRLIGHLARRGTTATPDPILPPVIDMGRFRTLQALIRRRQRTQTRTREGSGELTGLIFCGECGSRMYIGPNGKRWTRYACAKQEGHAMAISGDFVHAEMARQLFELIPAAELALEEAALEDEQDAWTELRRAVEQLEWKRDELRHDYYELHLVERDEYESSMRDTAERLEVLRAKLADSDDDRVILSAQEGLGDLPELWPDMTPAERRGVFGIWLRRVEIVRAPRMGKRTNPDRLVPDWRVHKPAGAATEGA